MLTNIFFIAICGYFGGLIAATSWKHVNVHKKHDHPFYLIPPHTIAFPYKIKTRQSATLLAPVKGLLPANTSIRFRATYLPSHGIIPSEKGFVLFDAYATGAPSRTILATKHASSTLHIHNTTLQSHFSYTTGAEWLLEVMDKKKKTLFSRSRKALGAKPLTEGTVEIGLYDVVLHQNRGGPAGWAVILNNSLRLCIPYKDKKGNLRIWSEGFSCITPSPKKPFIMVLNKDDSLDIWHTHSLRTHGQPLAIPIVTRIHFRCGRQPCCTTIAPPNNYDLWPKEAQTFFTWEQKYVAALVYKLQNVKHVASQRMAGNPLKHKKIIQQTLHRIGYKQTLTYDNLIQFKKPFMLTSPLA